MRNELTTDVEVEPAPEQKPTRRTPSVLEEWLAVVLLAVWFLAVATWLLVAARFMLAAISR